MLAGPSCPCASLTVPGHVWTTRPQSIQTSLRSCFDRRSLTSGKRLRLDQGFSSYVCHADPPGTSVDQKRESNAEKSDSEDDLAKLREGVPQLQQRRKRQADSSDWISSQLTRRFGLAGGLAWLGVLLFGVVSEQVKTRLEDRAAEEGTKDVTNATEVDLGAGLVYKDIRIGGGQSVQQGFLTVLHYRGYVNGEVFEDTRDRKKPIVFLYGSRPFTAGLCLGVEKGLQGMKAGGIRDIIVPPSLGFGDRGISLRGTEHAPGKEPAADVPPNATLQYELELLRVSIPPS